MKVGFIVPKLSGGGAEYVAREWASYLVDANIEVHVFATQSAQDDTAADGFSVVVMPSTPLMGRIRHLRSQVAERDLDVVIGVMPYWNLLAMLAVKFRLGARAKVVVSSHTIESPYGAKRGRGFALQTWLAAWIYRFADAFVASSHPVAAEAVAKYGIDRSRLWVVPNPVFPTPVKRGDLAGSVAGKNGVVTDALIVPGRLVSQKRPELAIEVAAAIGRQHGTSPQVWYVGDGPEAASLEIKAKAAGVNIKMIAWDAHWPSLVPPSGVVLMPSMLEGFGNVLLDAAAAGLPVVVSSKALGVADAVIPGVTGILVVGDSTQHYVDGVLAVHETHSCDNSTVDRWLNRFTRENSGAQMLSVITALKRSDRR